jgi:hypothetical protein
MITSFEIVPYRGASPLSFRASKHEVEEILGRPDSFHLTEYPPRMALSPVFEARYSDANMNLAYDLDHKLTYICFTQFPDSSRRTVLFEGINLFDDDDAFERLLAKDSESFEWVGFVFLMSTGMRLEGYHKVSDDGRIVSLFERGRYDQKLPKFRPCKG